MKLSQFSIPENIDTPAVKAQLIEYMKWRSAMGGGFRWRKPELTFQRWIHKLSAMGPDLAIASLDHCMDNEYKGLIEAPLSQVKKAQPKAPGGITSENWRDPAKAAYQADPDYWEHLGWTYERLQATTSFYDLPISLRQQVIREAAARGIHL